MKKALWTELRNDLNAVARQLAASESGTSAREVVETFHKERAELIRAASEFLIDTALTRLVGDVIKRRADKDINVDVRVIAATNKDLLKEVEAKNFRLDLYHRLSVILIHVPSLNERRDDIPMLVEQFLEDICSDYGIAVKLIDADAIKLLQQYNWTGNIRELRNVVERLVILSGKSITAEDVKSYVMPK